MSLRVVHPHDGKHFRQRLYERFGISLTASNLWDLRDRLKTAMKVHTYPTGIIVYLMKIQEKPMYVLYDPNSQWFVTVKKLSALRKMELASIENPLYN